MGRIRLAALVLLVALAAVLNLPADTALAATIITVNTVVDETNADGDCSLREAVRAANLNLAQDACAAGSDADTINVPAGTYVLSIGGAGEEDAVTGDLDIGEDLTIAGAGEGSTIIDQASSDRVFHVTGAFTVNISGVSITGGQELNGGAGIYNGGGVLQLDNSTVSGNTTDGDGGGIYQAAGTMTLNSSTVSGNSAGAGGGFGSGGGINQAGGTMTLNSSTVAGNSSSIFGGGIRQAFGTILTLDNSTVSGNSADGGGGIYNGGGTLTLDNSTVSGNSAVTGGGIRQIGSGTMTLNSSTVAGNSASGNDGGILNFGGATINSSTVSGNTTNGIGAGIDNVGSLSLSNSTVSGNLAGGAGGGIVNSGGLTITGSTVSGNSTGTTGGGIYNINSVDLRNTIVANSASGGNCSGGVSSGGFNLSSDASCALAGFGDMNSTNPLLGPLANNGGLTRTHALLDGSPAVDAGLPTTNALCSGANDFDQRGVVRPQGLRCDIGAYEADDSDGDGVPDPLDSDDDGDSVPDTLDACPLATEDLDGFEDGDGCPDADNDGDGVCDAGLSAVSCSGSDSGQTAFYPPGHDHTPSTIDCRNMAEDYDAFKDSDGCPEPDNDNDTFPDLADDCPGTDAVTGPDGALGVGADLNHNGRNVNPTETWPTYSSDGNDDVRYTFEDFDTVLDNDGCHDSPGDDLDQDGFTDEAEALFIGTDPADACGTDGWPADLSSITFPINSLNKVNLPDLQLYITPVRRLGTSPIVDANYSARFDIVPGPGPFGKYINVADMQKLAFVIPPFYGTPTRAFNGPECVYPP